MKKILLASAMLSSCMAINAALTIDDESGTVKISDNPSLSLSDIDFRGVSDSPIQAVLSIDTDTVFDASSGRMSVYGNGAMHVDDGVSLKISNANGTEDIGGALYVMQAKFELSGTAGNMLVFENNTLNPSRVEGQNVGGAAVGLFLADSSFTGSNLKFTGNTVYSQAQKGVLGGAYSSYMGDSDLSNVVFENNKAVSIANGNTGGGAIGSFLSGGGSVLLSIKGGSFTGNEALLNYDDSSKYATGGAIYLERQNLSISGTSSVPVLFKDNKAAHAFSGSAYGGALAIVLAASSNVADAKFEGNSAENASGLGGYGGAVYVQGSAGSKHSFTRTDFEGNSAQYGGGMYVLAGDVELNDVNMTNNIGNLGGALYASSNVNVAFNVSAGKTSTISGNKSFGGDMSGIYLNGATSFSVNTESGAVFDMRDSLNAVARVGGTAFSKKGAGTWKMGGDNKITSADSTRYADFTIQSGTVEMLEGSSFKLEGADSTFVIESGAALDVRKLSATAAVSIDGALRLTSQSVVKFDANNLNSTTALIHSALFGLDIVLSAEDGTISIDVENLPADVPNQRFALFTFDDFVHDYQNGSDANEFFVLKGTNSQYYSFEWGDGVLYIIQNVPEPAAYAALLGLIALAAIVYRRKI